MALQVRGLRAVLANATLRAGAGQLPLPQPLLLWELGVPKAGVPHGCRDPAAPRGEGRSGRLCSTPRHNSLLCGWSESIFSNHTRLLLFIFGQRQQFQHPPPIWRGSPVIPERSAIHLKFHHSAPEQANSGWLARPSCPEPSLHLPPAWEMTEAAPAPAVAGPPSPPPADFHLEAISGAGGPAPALS